MVVPSKHPGVSLTVHTWGMFNEAKSIILYLFVLFLSPAVLYKSPVIQLVKRDL
jgi:hypothetical protein